MNRWNRGVRGLLMALAGLALLTGLWTGLLRLGFIPSLGPGPGFARLHGPLMLAFLGTLIALERAVALQTLRRRWAFLVPLLSGLGTLALLGGFPTTGAGLLVLAGLGLLGAYAELWQRAPHGRLFTGTMALGAAGWLVGSILWLLGRPIGEASLWWVSFPVLTIAGERLELSRLRRLPSSALRSFGFALGVLLVGLTLLSMGQPSIPALGPRTVGLGLLGLTLWLTRYDIALRTIKQKGLPRFISLCLLTGYAWLLVSSLLLLVYGLARYDALLHAVFLGFVFSMIFGHAPIIFPALLRIPIPFRVSFYTHWGLLHLSLLIRVIGDLAGWLPGQRWGGLLGVLAILLFLGNTLFATLSAPQRRREGTSARSS